MTLSRFVIKMVSGKKIYVNSENINIGSYQSHTVPSVVLHFGYKPFFFEAYKHKLWMINVCARKVSCITR